VPPEINFGGELMLLGYNLRPATVEAGGLFDWTSIGRRRKKLTTEYSAYAHIKDAQSTLWSPKDGPRPGGYWDYPPTTTWPLDEYAQDSYQIQVLPGTPSGEYDLVVGAFSKATLEGLDVVDERGVAVGTSIENPMQVNLGDQATFLGYDLDTTEVKPGGALHLTLYWQARGEIKRWYKVFTHLLDDQGRIWAQKDSVPVAGERPTTGWMEGEVIVDQYELVVDPEASGGDYVLEVGMYEEGAGRRLRVLNEGGQTVVFYSSLSLANFVATGYRSGQSAIAP